MAILRTPRTRQPSAQTRLKGPGQAFTPGALTTSCAAEIVPNNLGQSFLHVRPAADSVEFAARPSINGAPGCTLVWVGYFDGGTGTGDEGLFGNRYSTNTNSYRC